MPDEGGYGGGGAIDAPVVGMLVGIPVFTGYFGVLLRTVPKRHGHALYQRIRAWFPNSAWNPLTEATNGIFSLASSILLIMETYDISNAFMRWSYATDSFVTCFFLLNFLFSWYIASSTQAYLASPYAIVDILTVTPSLLAIAMGYGNKATSVYKLLRVLRLFRVLRVYDGIMSLDLLRTGRSSRSQSRAVKSQFAFMLFTFGVVLFVLAGFVNAMVVNENADWGLGHGHMPFHDALYYCVVTFGTVGYGDISPSTTVGRLVMSTLICGAFVFVPVQTARLIYLLSIRPRYGGHVPSNKANNHIIIGCDSTCVDRVRILLSEIFADTFVEQKHVVVMVPANPSVEVDRSWNGLIVQWVNQLTFLKGDLRNPADLARAAADRADACFILTNNAGRDPLKDDKVAFMRAITAHEFNPFIKLYVLVTHVETRRQLLSMGLEASNIISTNDVVQKLMAQTCVNAGMSTLLANVVTACPELSDVLDVFKKGAHDFKGKGWCWWLLSPHMAIRKRRYHRLMRGVTLKDAEVEYVCSLGNTIVLYDQLGFAFEGTSMQDVALSIFHSCGAVLIAVVKRYDKDGRTPWGEESDPTRRGAMLYPGCNYRMEKDDVGYFMARSRGDTIKISAACIAHMEEMEDKEIEMRTNSNSGGDLLARSSTVNLLSPSREDKRAGHAGAESRRVLGGVNMADGVLRSAKSHASGGVAVVMTGLKSWTGPIQSLLSPRHGQTHMARQSIHMTTSQMKALTGIGWEMPPSIYLPAGHIVVIAQSVASVWGLVKKLAGQKEVGRSGLSDGQEKRKRVVLLCKGFSSHEHEARRLEKAVRSHPDFERVTIITGTLDDVHLSKARVPHACLVCISSAAERHIAFSSAYTVAVDAEDRDAMTVRILGEVLSLAGASVRVVCDLNMASSAEQHQVLSSRVRRLWIEQMAAKNASRSSIGVDRTTMGTPDTSRRNKNGANSGGGGGGDSGGGGEGEGDAEGQRRRVGRATSVLFGTRNADTPPFPAPTLQSATSQPNRPSQADSEEDTAGSLPARPKMRRAASTTSVNRYVIDDGSGAHARAAVTDATVDHRAGGAGTDSIRSLETTDRTHPSWRGWAGSRASTRALEVDRQDRHHQHRHHHQHHQQRREDPTLRMSLNSTIMEFFRVRPTQPKPVFFNHAALKSGFSSGDVVMSDMPELLMLQTYLTGGEDNITEGSYVHAQLSEVVSRLLEPPREVVTKVSEQIVELGPQQTVADPSLDASTRLFGKEKVVRQPHEAGEHPDMYPSFRGPIPTFAQRRAAQLEGERGGGGGEGLPPLKAASAAAVAAAEASPPARRAASFTAALEDDTLVIGNTHIAEHPPLRHAYVKKIAVPTEFFEQAKGDPTFEELFVWLLGTYDIVAVGVQRFFPVDDIMGTVAKYIGRADTTVDSPVRGERGGGGGGGKGGGATGSGSNTGAPTSRTGSSVDVFGGSTTDVMRRSFRDLGVLPLAARSGGQGGAARTAAKNALRDHLCINCPRKQMKIDPEDNVYVIVPEPWDDDAEDDYNDDDDDADDDQIGDGDDGGGTSEVGDGADDEGEQADMKDGGFVPPLTVRKQPTHPLASVAEAKSIDERSVGLRGGVSGESEEQSALQLHQWALKAFMWKRELAAAAAAGKEVDEVKRESYNHLVNHMPDAYPCQNCKTRYGSPPAMMSCGHLICTNCLADVSRGADTGFRCPFCREVVDFASVLDAS